MITKRPLWAGRARPEKTTRCPLLGVVALRRSETLIRTKTSWIGLVVAGLLAATTWYWLFTVGVRLKPYRPAASVLVVATALRPANG
jgi:hypothetical protein